MTGRHENYQYTECGLSNVFLIGVLVFHCDCGEIAVQLPATVALHRFIALSLIKKKTLLSGEELRFLRKHVNYSATELADMLATTKVSMSRWENGLPISKNMDRLLRLAFFAAMLQRDAEEAIGPEEEGNQIPALIAFAKDVKSFDINSFLKHIRDVHEQSSIKIDPTKLNDIAITDGVTLIEDGSPSALIN